MANYPPPMGGGGGGAGLATHAAVGLHLFFFPDALRLKSSIYPSKYATPKI